MTYEKAMEKAAADYLRNTLIGCGWNVKAAAMASGLNRSHLYELIKRHGIERPSCPFQRRPNDPPPMSARALREWDDMLACCGKRAPGLAA